MEGGDLGQRMLGSLHPQNDDFLYTHLPMAIRLGQSRLLSEIRALEGQDSWVLFLAIADSIYGLGQVPALAHASVSLVVKQG